MISLINKLKDGERAVFSNHESIERKQGNFIYHYGDGEGGGGKRKIVESKIKDIVIDGIRSDVRDYYQQMPVGSMYAKGGSMKVGDKKVYNKLVGRKGNEYYFLDYIFKHDEDFMGATGTIVTPVHSNYFEYATSRDGLAERYLDAMSESEWCNTLGLDEDDCTEEEIIDGIENLYRAGELQPFEECSSKEESQMREIAEFSDSNKYPLFEVIGGGRSFYADPKFDEVYDKTLLALIIKAESKKLANGGGVGELEIGNEVELELNNGKTIKGKVEKINPLKIRTDASSTQVIPNALIKNIKKYAKGGGVEMNNNTFVNILLNYGFVEKRSSYGVRHFYNKSKDFYASLDEKQRKLDIYKDDDMVVQGREYTGYSIQSVIDFLNKNGFESGHKYAKGGGVDTELKEALGIADGGSVFTQDFFDKYELVKETYSTKKNPNADELAKNRKKELEEQGFLVKMRKVSFEDLARSVGYFIVAVKRKNDTYAKGGRVGEKITQADLLNQNFKEAKEHIIEIHKRVKLKSGNELLLLKKESGWGIAKYNPKSKKELQWNEFTDKETANYWIDKVDVDKFANGGGVGSKKDKANKKLEKHIEYEFVNTDMGSGWSFSLDGFDLEMTYLDIFDADGIDDYDSLSKEDKKYYYEDWKDSLFESSYEQFKELAFKKYGNYYMENGGNMNNDNPYICTYEIGGL